VLADTGRVYAVPYNATTVLEISPNDTTQALGIVVDGVTQGLNGGVSGGRLFSEAAFVNGTVFGIPYAAATLLTVDPSTTPATLSLHGTTGMTPRLSNSSGSERYWFRRARVYYGGRGYTASPPITVADPDDTSGTTMQIDSTIQITSIVTSADITVEGTGYVESPTIQFGPFSGGPWQNTTPVALRPSPYAATPTMELVDPADDQKGYKLTGITLTNGGDGIADAVPDVRIVGGKGSTARATATVVNQQVILVSIPEGRGGKGYTSPPTVRISGGGGRGANSCE